MKSPYDKLAKIYTNCSGHMTKMANMPIYGKNFLKKSSFREPEGPLFWDLVCIIGVWGLLRFSNDDPRLTLIYLMSQSNLLPYAFKWGNF